MTMLFRLLAIFAWLVRSCYSENGPILGGFFANKTQFSYVVSVQEKRRFNSTEIYSHKCGGTLVDRWYVFTAAHCVAWKSLKNGVLRPRLAADFVILTGTRNIDFLEPGARFRPVEEILVHKNFKEHETLNRLWLSDMALLKLNSKIEDDILARSAVFPKEEQTESQLKEFKYEYRICLHPGWSLSGSGSSSNSPVLRFIRMKLLPDDQCDKVFCKAYPDSCAAYNVSKFEMICAISETDPKPCFVDAGTPLVCDGRIFGMHSGSGYCGIAGLPEYYVSVATAYRFFHSLDFYLNRGAPQITSFVLLTSVALSAIINNS